MLSKCKFVSLFKRALVLLALMLLCVPGVAKAMFNFKLNPGYDAQYLEDWFRPDPSSQKFRVIPLAEKESGDPVNIEIRSFELSKAESALPDSLLIEKMLQKHKDYLEDNLNFDYEISEPTLLKIKGASLSFHFRTDLPGDPDVVLITDYARKGNNMYIFRFFCPAPLFEKYLTDYYLMLDGFVLK